MNLTIKTLSALAIATAALAATAMPSSALPYHPPGVFKGIGYHPAQPPSWGKFRGIDGRILGSLRGHGPIQCLACSLPHPRPIKPHPIHWGHGHDWGHWYGWHHRPEFYGIGGRVEGIAMRGPGPASSAPVRASAPAPQSAASPCNCLTEQQLPDGSVLFQNTCTKESAIAPPQQVGAR